MRRMAPDPVSDLLHRGTRAEQLAAALTARIRDRGLLAGDPVGTFESLRGETGVAYSTVSEAVRLLRDRGVVEVRQGRGGGIFVADVSPVVRLRHTLLADLADPAAVADAIELRDHLELLVDVAAARHRTREDVVDLRRAVTAMADAPDWGAVLDANWALHERIAAIGPNRMVRSVYVATLGPLRASTRRLDGGAADDYRAQRIAVHRELVEAIADGDVDVLPAVVDRHNAP
jgi:DNA-binding FadR family transcriptional regulator